MSSTMSDNDNRNVKFKFVIKGHPELDSTRCKGCGRQLYRVLTKGSGAVIEIKCPRCKTVNRFP